MRLPRALLLKVEGCDGESNAWYENDAVTVCYEYLADVLRNAPKETTAAGVTRTDAIVGPTLEVFVHEVGHAVFDYLPCRSWDARKTQQISLLPTSCCNSPRATPAD